MATLFTRIINGELPGRFVWSDDHCVAFLTIAPISQGHVLVVPRAEVDHWIDADTATWAHVNEVARIVGGAVHRAFGHRRVAVVVAGFEVPHLHVHVFGVDDERSISFEHADPSVDPARLDADQAAIVAQLRADGHEDRVPTSP